MQVVRCNGQWFEIMPKPYEPERQTHEIAWLMIQSGASSQEAYRAWYASEQEKVNVLYPSFRKETNGT